MATMNVDKWVRKIKRGSAVFFLLLFCMAGMLTACGREPGINSIPSESGENSEEDGASMGVGTLSASEVGMDSVAGETIPDSKVPESEGAETPDAAALEMDAMQEMFGANCISDQTFEVQLSEYDQAVYFVPFAPSSENPQFRMQLIQNGQVLKELHDYVPEGLEGEKFSSLDAVAFADVDFDGNTDILLLETYGDTRFAAVYCGERDEWEGWDDGVRVSFYVHDTLSEALSDQVNPLTVSEIFGFLTDGKKNGEFVSYQEAYEAVSRVYDLSPNRMEYNLIYFDEDDIPELVVGVSGYWMSMFTYAAGQVYCLMNEWGYGAFGNAGYEYVPGKNSLRNYDADMGINTFNITYMAVGEQHTMEPVVRIKLVNYLEDENEITGEQCTVYVNGVEVPEDEDIDYDVGEYEWIETILSRQELLEKLGQEQDTAAEVAAEGEGNARQWQVYIHPDVPEPLAEVLEQYEKVMKADFTLDELWDRQSDKWEGLGIEELYVYDEVYCHWPYATEEDRDICIGYSLEDMTGDGIPELIMGVGYYHDETLKFVPRIVYYVGEAGDIQSMETSPYFDMTMYEGGIVEYVSGGVDYTITYYQYSQETQDFELAEALGAHWDDENRVDVEPYRENGQIITDGEYAREMLTEEEFQRIREQYTQKKIEPEWFPLCRPSWHILVSSGRDYDLYLEGISTDLWLEETGERQLGFSIYDKEGALVQELVETSPYLPYMPDVYYAENTNIDWDEGWGHHAGNFYFQDMNFDGEEDLVLLWMNIRYPHWKVYLWREEEGVFREELSGNGSDEDEGVFCYYNVVEEKKYIDEYIPNGATQTIIYRTRYDEEWGYMCVGALEVYSYRDQWETSDNRNERYQEYFYEDGICVGETEIISREEVSDLWSDVWSDLLE